MCAIAVGGAVFGISKLIGGGKGRGIISEIINPDDSDRRIGQWQFEKEETILIVPVKTTMKIGFEEDGSLLISSKINAAGLDVSKIVSQLSGFWGSNLLSTDGFANLDAVSYKAQGFEDKGIILFSSKSDEELGLMLYRIYDNGKLILLTYDGGNEEELIKLFKENNISDEKLEQILTSAEKDFNAAVNKDFYFEKR
ncbi:MAG: hypothetical protein LBJ12_02875 [Oscillospiraceae bacterium]|nr:hypothetical protein [Oscillospiraceae bacterium]